MRQLRKKYNKGGKFLQDSDKTHYYRIPTDVTILRDLKEVYVVEVMCQGTQFYLATVDKEKYLRELARIYSFLLAQRQNVYARINIEIDSDDVEYVTEANFDKYIYTNAQ